MPHISRPRVAFPRSSRLDPPHVHLRLMPLTVAATTAACIVNAYTTPPYALAASEAARPPRCTSATSARHSRTLHGRTAYGIDRAGVAASQHPRRGVAMSAE
jgi:hypothetical protein